MFSLYLVQSQKAIQLLCGWEPSGLAVPKNKRVGDSIVTMEEKRGSIRFKILCLWPWRGMHEQCFRHPAGKWIRRICPEQGGTQEYNETFPVFLKYRKEPVQELKRHTCVSFGLKDRTFLRHAFPHQGKKCLDGIYAERDHVHGKDGMGTFTGVTLQARISRRSSFSAPSSHNVRYLG